MLIVFCSTLSRVEDWEDREVWAEYHLDCLREYLPYENGVPSHDTMQRVMGMLSTEYFQQAYNKWIEEFEAGKGINLRKIICIDGKTMKGNKRNDSKPNHIVTAWSKDGGFSLGQKAVEEKSNEITAIPKLLDTLNIKGSIITIDAMGTQTAIAQKIREKRCHYVLAVKENQKSLCDDISLYFEDKKQSDSSKQAIVIFCIIVCRFNCVWIIKKRTNENDHFTHLNFNDNKLRQHCTKLILKISATQDSRFSIVTLNIFCIMRCCLKLLYHSFLA